MNIIQACDVLIQNELVQLLGWVDQLIAGLSNTY